MFISASMELMELDLKRQKEMMEEIKSGGDRGVSVSGPLSLWVILIIISITLEVFIIPNATMLGIQKYSGALGAIATYIFYFPGFIVIPIFIGILVGDNAGRVSYKLSAGIIKGVVSGIYTAFFYIIFIYIIYLVMSHVNPAFIQIYNIQDYTYYLAAVPGIIVILVTTLISTLSSVKK